MILIFAAAVVFVVEAAFLRGRLSRLANLQVRRLWLVWMALIYQVVVISVLPDREHVLLAVANLASYGLGGAFLWVNRHIAGAWLVGVGMGCNVFAIACNGGVMPASRSALDLSGWRPTPDHFQNSAFVAHANLALLGDVLAVPRWMPGHDVFSIGDLLIVAGFGVALWRCCAQPAADRPAPRQAATVLPGVLPPL